MNTAQAEPEQSAQAQEPATESTAALETSTPAEQPAAQPAETQVAENKPDVQTAKSIADLDRMVDDMFSEKPASEPQPAETKTEPHPAEETKKPDEEEDVSSEQKPPAERIRLTSLNNSDKALINTAVQMVRDGLAENIPNAIAKLTGWPEAAREETKIENSEPPTDPYEHAIEAKKTEIADVLQKLKSAKEDYNDALQTELTDKLIDLRSDIKLLDFERKQLAEQTARQKEAESKAAYQNYYDTFRQQAVALYPDADNPESTLFQQIQEDVSWYEQHNPAIFNTPNYPLLIASSAAARIGLAPKFQAPPAAQAPAAPAAIAPSPNAKVAARPASPLVGANATTASSDIKTAIRQVEAIRNPHDLDALAEAVFSSR